MAVVAALHPAVDLPAALASGYRDIWRLALHGGYPVILATLVYGLLRALVGRCPIAVGVLAVGIPTGLTLPISMAALFDLRSGRANGDVLSQPEFLEFGVTVALISVGLWCAIAWADLSGSRK